MSSSLLFKKKKKGFTPTLNFGTSVFVRQYLSFTQFISSTFSKGGKLLRTLLRTVPKYSTGFTLVEMIVVIAIFSILSAVVLLNYRGFGSDLLLTNLSYDIALSLRKAQSYGVSVKSLSSSSNFTYSYGVHFDLGSPAALEANSTQYFLFIDNSTADNNANVYDPGDTILETYTITNQNRILELCYRINSGDISDTCTNSGSVNPAVIDILFKRPNPDAIITRCPNDNALSSCATNNALAKIRLESVRGLIRDVTIRDTGEISVK